MTSLLGEEPVASLPNHLLTLQAGCPLDEQIGLGILEPVGTHPDFRGRGLGREVVLESIRRAAALGAKKVCVGSGQRFYEAIGFEKKYVSYRWTRKF